MPKCRVWVQIFNIVSVYLVCKQMCRNDRPFTEQNLYLGLANLQSSFKKTDYLHD